MTAGLSLYKGELPPSINNKKLKRLRLIPPYMKYGAWWVSSETHLIFKIMFNDNALMITQRQRNAVKFCEDWLEIKFDGNIENFHDVSDFLSLHLEDAKDLFNDALSSYYSFIADKDWA